MIRSSISPIHATWKSAVTAIFAIAALSVSPDAAAKEPGGDTKLIKRGQYLVEFGGCHDCHSPKKMAANGMPEVIPALALSGHPAEQVSAAPKPSEPWLVSTVASLTVWSGPWGVSYSANLTPDPETGLGRWTEQNFVEAMRSGRHMGRGRPILPPMPFSAVAKLTDTDIKAVFAYLKSIPAVKNRVPDPTPPEAPSSAAAGTGTSPTGTGTSPTGIGTSPTGIGTSTGR